MGESFSQLQVCCCGKSAEWRPVEVESQPRPAPPTRYEPDEPPGRKRSSTAPRVVEEPRVIPQVQVLEDVWTNLFVQQRRKSSMFGLGAVGDGGLDISMKNDDGSPKKSVEALPTGSRGTRAGHSMFEDRKNNKDDGISIDSVAQVADIKASVAKLGDGKWRIHGIHVEKIVAAGLQRLDRLLTEEGVMELPRNMLGRSLLLRESLFKDLLSGERTIKAVPVNDIAASQKDLVHLSVRQLLRIRALNIDFAKGGDSVHATFISMLEGLIFQRLGQTAASSKDPAELPSAKKLGREMVMIVAAAKYIPSPDCWVCWFEDERIFFHVGRLACTESAGIALSDNGAVLEFVDKSELDRNSGGQRYWFEMMVGLAKSESALSAPVQGSFVGQSFNGPSGDELKNALGGLRKTGRA